MSVSRQKSTACCLINKIKLTLRELMQRPSRKPASSLDALIFKADKELKPISLLGLTDSHPLYKMLVQQISQYNELLKHGHKTYHYEQSMYEELASVLKNIHPNNAEKQKILYQMSDWLKQKQKEVYFQKQQSELFKYKHKTKDHKRPLYKDYLSYNPYDNKKFLSYSKLVGQPEHILPYIRGNRTAIPEITPPAERLKHYKHKYLIAMTGISQQRYYKKQSRIVYKVEKPPAYTKQYEPSIDIDTTMPGESIETQELMLEQLEQPYQQMAEVPEEIEEQYDEYVDDPLRPNHKIFVKAQEPEIQEGPTYKEYDKASASVHQRYLQLINKQYREAEEDKVVRQKYQRWAREKARATNELSRRREVKTMRKSLSPVKVIKNEDVIEISKTLILKNTYNFSDFSNILPSIDTSPQKRMSCAEFYQSLFENKITKQKKHVLKSIVIGEDEEAEEKPRVPKPILRLAQAEYRKYRSIGSILDYFSPYKYHVKQLQYAIELKYRLAKDGFHNINMKQLSKALAIPLINYNPYAPLPSVILPHNPFFVVPKTKKKKK